MITVLRDTITTGLSSDKIRAKVIREGTGCNPSMSYGNSQVGSFHAKRHIDRKQETAKDNYVQYGKNKKKKLGKFQHSTSGSSGGSSGNAGKPSKHGGKGKKVPLPTDICWRCGKRQTLERPGL